MTETLIESTDLRVRLIHDECPGVPYDDGGSPIVHAEHTYSGETRAQQVDDCTSYRVHPRIIEALERFQSGPEFERYLRVFHGVTKVVWFGDGNYVSFDPADWRESMGLTDEYLAERPDVREGLVNVDEFQAYYEGDVYGYVVERVELWRNETTGAKREEWGEVDSCWGFYGHKYATEAATEAYESELVAA